MSITYRDKTFCINKECIKECQDRLTPEIIKAAKEWWGKDDPPIAMADYDCDRKDLK